MRQSSGPEVCEVKGSSRRQKYNTKDTSATESKPRSPVTPTKRKLDYKDCSVTPPKLKSYENSPPSTPSTLIHRLTLMSPEKSSRKPLFDKYQLARRALHSCVPNKLPTREKEIEYLRGFISDCVEGKQSGSLYISGPPGTGKTAALSLVLQQINLTGLKSIFINCTKIKSSKVIYERIANDLALKLTGKSQKECLSTVEGYLQKSKKMLLLILDEIDQLDSKNQAVLYTIFEWPASFRSKIILIGIANALDLTDRILPQLQVRCELKPKLMNFAPYSKQNIMDIFKERLEQSDAVSVFSPMAIQMLAGKVAAVSGDLRRALDIGRRVIELAERNKSNCMLQPIENTGKDKTDTVDIKHVMNVLNNVYGTTHCLNNETEDTFPLQQKVIICSLILILKNSQNKDITIGRLHEIYKRVCQKRNLLAVDQGEFMGVCALIETRGIIRVAGKKEPRLKKVVLEWDEEDVATALKDKQLMSSILNDVVCLGR